MAILNNFKGSAASKSARLKETAKKNAQKRKAKELAELQEKANRSRWRQVEQAGVKFWTNEYTGEARFEDPREDDEGEGEAKSFYDLQVNKPRIAEGRGHGETPIATGAIVYEELKPEFDQVMRFLAGESKDYE